MQVVPEKRPLNGFTSSSSVVGELTVTLLLVAVSSVTVLFFCCNCHVQALAQLATIFTLE